ncbi:MAG: ATP-dependent DNA helicase RecG [Candidatus Pacebacteria bacterium]|nr:ATP-dependent DNA helicase RecG [Candidatus Paceibacterota bacterium]
MLTLTTELAHIQGINKRLQDGLKKLGLVTVRDLVLHLPHRYDDFSNAATTADIAVGQIATVRARVSKIEMRRSFRRNMAIVEAILEDHMGSVRAVWFNQPYIMRSLPVGTVGNFAGKATASQGALYLSNPVYEPAYAETKHTEGLVPVYPETKGMTSRGIRYLMHPILDALKDVPECVPADVFKKLGLPSFLEALRILHMPESLEATEPAKKRVALEDIFLLQLTNLQAKMKLAQEPAHGVPWTDAERDALLAELPFTLTGSQRTSLDEILADTKRPHPMNRLLQGDVGSGKTVVIAVAALLAARHGFQTAILAPTETLARQHYRTLGKIFNRVVHDWSLNFALMTSAECRASYGEGLETDLPKARVASRIADGHLKIVIGTHALIQKGVVFPRLALVAVDEQHRFGVEQRAALTKRAGNVAAALPHFLSMSATPIPRTLSLTIFGDLDLSIIDELPSGRKPIITKIVAATDRPKAHAFIRQEIKKGRQAFVICPRIEESEDKDDATAIPNAWSDVKAVTQEYEKLAKEIFPDLKVAMLHGKMKSAEKAKVMDDFAKNKTNILVATSVIEVGVDVPNAVIMAIEDADRFGLAQLYQFRGRVGRGEHQSACLLFTANKSAVSRERLKALVNAKNGFELAELDLAMRGPGEFLGRTQTGMPDIAMNALNNMELVKAAREAAAKVLKEDNNLKQNPLLEERLSAFRKAVHLE